MTEFKRGTKRRWQNVDPVPWEVGTKGSGAFITIPAGTEFESNVPWYGRWFVSPDDPRFLLAALVHDYLLESGIYGRTQAAAEWYDGARAGGAPSFKSKIGYVAVAVIAVWNE
jgi:hypothetical protein